MAIPAVNFSPLPSGSPGLTTGVSVQTAVCVEPYAAGVATIVGDGAASTAVINWIDGTQTLSFTPTAVQVQIIGGTDTVSTLKATSPGPVTAITATSFTVNFTVVPANTATVKLLFEAFR